MNGPILFQNTLLTIIAALLLVLVIQNSQSRAPSWEMSVNTAPQSDQGYDQGGGMSQGMAPHSVGKAGSPVPQMKTSMVFQALKAFPKGCDGMRILDECNSPDATSVKNEILELEDSGKGPRQIFDAIIAKYGEKVLTEQALQIRKMRIGGHGK